MSARAAALLLVAACGDGGEAMPAPTADPGVVVSGAPSIQQVFASCDPDGGTWVIQVVTSRWAGGATLRWTEDGDYVETHTGFRSVRAQPDGSGDVLRADLEVQIDFRATGDGRTAFACRDAPSALLWIVDLGGQVADCVRIGASTDLLAGAPDVPPCERELAVTPAG